MIPANAEAAEVFPRVLHVSPFPFSLSGANRSMLTLVREMAGRGHTYVFAPASGQLTDLAAEYGAVVGYAYEVWPSVRVVRGLWTILSLMRFARKFDVQIINAHSAIANHYCRYAARFLGIPLVTHQRDTYSNDYFHSDLEAADRIVSISDFVHDCLPPALKTKSSVIHNPVWIDSEQRLLSVSYSSSRLRIGMAARCTPDKGHDVFLKAALPLIESHGVVIEIWGVDGEYENTIRRMVSDYNASLWPSVRFEPFRKDVGEFYRRMDIVVSPSTYPEPMGRVPIEAMAWKKPVIASDSGGQSELLRWNTDAIFENGDADELRSKLIHLVENPILRETVGNQGFKYVTANHSHVSYCDQMLSLYIDLIGR